MELDILQTILRTLASAMKTPVMILLIIMVAFSLFCIGWMLSEVLGERRHLKVSLPRLLDEMKANPEAIPELIERSGLLKRQKLALGELTRHPDYTPKMMESLADHLIEGEESHYRSILKVTSLMSKLSPMLGLLGTLIPLGPGIIALGQGDTLTLSSSMLTAFDTTVAGLLAAGICLVVHTFRSQWYSRYMSDFETLADCIVEIEKVKSEKVNA